VANTPKRNRPGKRAGGSGKETRDDRRAMVEQMRRQQESADKRRNLIFVGIAATLGVGLIAAAAIPAYIQTQNSPRAQAINSFGLPAGEAGCGEVLSEPASGEMDHVPEGTIDYATVPPSFGPHRPMWTDFERKFYTPEDRPETEALVHNLEHGYTIVWYDQTIAEDEEALAALRGLSERIPEEPGMGKFKVSAWDDAYGEFPEGMHIGMSHWGGDDTGYRQLCESVSGEVINAFMLEYPSTNAPEPAGG
jgi:hypothetical protein